MAKIHKFVLANSLLDSPMATWLTLTGTLLGIVVVTVTLSHKQQERVTSSRQAIHNCYVPEMIYNNYAVLNSLRLIDV